MASARAGVLGRLEAIIARADLSASSLRHRSGCANTPAERLPRLRICGPGGTSATAKVSDDNVEVYFSPNGGCTDAIVAALGQAKEMLPRLIAERDARDRQISELQGSSGAPVVVRRVKRGRRAKNAVNLVDALATALKGKKSMGISELADAVLTAGYKTNLQGIPVHCE